MSVAGGMITSGTGQQFRRHQRPASTPAATPSPSSKRPSTGEVLEAGSARIDTISGATYTSDGYITSLQSALDKAGLLTGVRTLWPGRYPAAAAPASLLSVTRDRRRRTRRGASVPEAPPGGGKLIEL